MSVIAYHFVGATLTGGGAIPADGVWLVYNGNVEFCEQGLHASLDSFDSMLYARGTTLCQVECDLIVVQEPQKFVCRQRRILQRMDAASLLRTAARRYALDVVGLWNAPSTVVNYLTSGNESQRAAALAAAQAADAALGTAWSSPKQAARASVEACGPDPAHASAWASRHSLWAVTALNGNAAYEPAIAAQRTFFNDLTPF